MADPSPLSLREPREVAKPSQLPKWILQGVVVGVVASMVLLVVGGALALGGIQLPVQHAARGTTAGLSASAPQAAATCPSRQWILEALSHGHWIINETDATSWAWYMEFLKVNKKEWPAEFDATDMHQYSFWTNSSGIFYIMNHTIPASGFHLLFEAGSNGKWQKNPYPVLTPAGFDPSSAKVDLKGVRYVFEEPGVPFAESCHAWRCDMPMVQNVTVDGKIVAKEFIVTFWRELVSPTSMRCTLYITEAQAGESIAPWNKPGYGLPPSEKIQGRPKRLSYRYFQQTTQSMTDALKRLPCKKTGMVDDEEHLFC